MSEEQTAKQRFSSLFPDEESRAKFIEQRTRKKPAGWSGKSYPPYYKEDLAKALARDIDKMIETREPLLWRYAKHCEEAGISTRTLYLKINQALMYLIDLLDPTGKYKEWRSVVDIQCKSGLGILIEFKREFREVVVQTSEDLQADFLQAAKTNEVEPIYIPMWRKRMDEWLESDDIKPFSMIKLALTDEQVKELKIELANLEGIEADVKSSSIAIIKLSVEFPTSSSPEA